MIAVLDASAAVEIVLRRTHANRFAGTVKNADMVLSPLLFISEVSNAFWKYHRVAGYSITEAEKNIEQALALPDNYVNERELYREAFRLGCKYDHPIYDAVYLVLARRNSAQLLTLDKRLEALAKKTGIDLG
ncbi:MAG: type II toxin-antitoxin system VapC family toxin [Ignavibacteriaceae bacterium]|nr:type II toxin-antitoxin system VapC family toxin [Ignavibacteriaceae bacterium]